MFFSAPLGKEGCHTPLGDGVRLATAGCRKRVATALAVFTAVLSGIPWSVFNLRNDCCGAQAAHVLVFVMQPEKQGWNWYRTRRKGCGQPNRAECSRQEAGSIGNYGNGRVVVRWAGGKPGRSLCV